MLIDDGVYLGTSTKPEYLWLKCANRHSLITGATGSGKTVIGLPSSRLRPLRPTSGAHGSGGQDAGAHDRQATGR